MTSFLQSKEWLDFQRSLGREVLEYDKEGITAKIISHRLPFGRCYLYIPHGPTFDFNRMTGGFKNPAVNFVGWLKNAGRERKSIFIKAEPLIDSVAQVLAENRFKKSKKEIQPSKTVVIDLARSEEDLLAGMHHKTRYNIGVADKHGVAVSENKNDVDIFLKLLGKTTRRDRFSPHPADYYKKLIGQSGLKTKLYFAKHNDKPAAAALVLIHDDAGYYLHGASDYDSRALMSPYALHWHIIKQLKAEGLKHYDLWGISARKWPGVTRFKLGWGGRTVEFPGSFDLTISRFWHLAYNAASKF